MKIHYFILAICLTTAAVTVCEQGHISLICNKEAICKLAAAMVVTAFPRHERIVGGSITSIGTYPFAATLLHEQNNVNFRQDCGGTIINNRSILSAAHCWVGRGAVSRFRVRVGSTNASSGGAVHNVAQHITHPSYNVGTFMNNDIGIVRLATALAFGTNVRAGSIAGSNFNIADNTNVWAIGWGLTSWGGQQSEQLRHVQVRIESQARCQSVYGASAITANMICAGWHTDGRGTCTADSGGPLLHNAVAIGVTSFGTRCGEARFPHVYARVSRYTNWIRNNS